MKKRKELKVKPSEMYWCFFILLSVLLLNLHYLKTILLGRDEIFWLIISIFTFFIATLINYNKKIKEGFDYE